MKHPSVPPKFSLEEDFINWVNNFPTHSPRSDTRTLDRERLHVLIEKSISWAIDKELEIAQNFILEAWGAEDFLMFIRSPLPGAIRTSRPPDSFILDEQIREWVVDIDGAHTPYLICTKAAEFGSGLAYEEIVKFIDENLGYEYCLEYRKFRRPETVVMTPSEALEEFNLLMEELDGAGDYSNSADRIRLAMQTMAKEVSLGNLTWGSEK